MLETITAVNQAVNSFIWGIPAMVCIIGVGLLLSVRTGFLQLRKFPYAIKTTIGRIFRKKDASDGAMTPFQAVCTALAATVGTGNIAGVAGAIAIGGPGAVFRRWCSALLGKCTTVSQAALAVGASAPVFDTQSASWWAALCTILKTASAAGGSSSRCCTRCSAC